MKKTTLVKLFTLFLAIGVASCSSNSTDDGGDTGGGSGTSALTLTVDKSRVYDNTLVSYIVRDAAGAIVTSSAVVTVDGQVAPNGIALLTGVGTKSATATLGTETSNTVAVTVIAPSFTTKMLIEDYTGTWCGWCPRMSKSIQDLHSGQDGDRIIAIAVHNGDNMAFALEGQMRSRFGVTTFPSGILNRDARWSGSSNDLMNLSQPRALLNSVKPVGLAINSSLSGSTVNATVKVGFDLDQTGTKLVAVLLENGKVANQTNYTSNYGGGATITGFVHNEILRANFTDIFGDVIPDASSVGGGEYSATLSVAVPAGVNNANMEIVAFVVDSSNKVINVQRAPVGTNQPFD
ncbi:MAG: Omp28-related outer membrane protein [Nonlabens sp.]|nr:Omp28-related outer membrane protein [Nonlabens sp.]